MFLEGSLLESALQIVLRRVLERCLMVDSRRRSGSKKGSWKGLVDSRLYKVSSFKVIAGTESMTPSHVPKWDISGTHKGL